MIRPIPELENLLFKAASARRDRMPLVTQKDFVLPPAFIGRSAFVDAISQLFHAEQATARMCSIMAGRLQTPQANRLLEYQAEDEHHHSNLYESYLKRLGDFRPADPRIAAALQDMLDTPAGPEGVLAGYLIVLEGEAVKLQQDCIDLFPCPALRRVSRAVARDEARHIAFGHSYLAGAFRKMDRERRFAVYRHIYRSWQTVAADPQESGSFITAVLARKRSDYMSARWPRHHEALQRTGLLKPTERVPL